MGESPGLWDLPISVLSTLPPQWILSHQRDAKPLTKFLKISQSAPVSQCEPAGHSWWAVKVSGLGLSSQASGGLVGVQTGDKGVTRRKVWVSIWEQGSPTSRDGVGVQIRDSLSSPWWI